MGLAAFRLAVRMEYQRWMEMIWAGYDLLRLDGCDILTLSANGDLNVHYRYYRIQYTLLLIMTLAVSLTYICTCDTLQWGTGIRERCG